MAKIIGCNSNINKIIYSGYTITKVYACGGELVYSAQTNPTSADPFTITSQGSSSLKICEFSGNNLCYSVNGAECVQYHNCDKIQLQNGDTVKFYGWMDSGNTFGSFSASTGHYTVGGNIMSLIFSSEFEGKTLYTNGRYDNAFARLFYGCTGLTSAEYLYLPYNSANRCYYEMFSGCSGLTKGPDLNITLVTDCCDKMFYGCSSLNYIKCTALPASNADTTQWVYGVAANGTFARNPNMHGYNWTTGDSGIPSGWTVVDA